MFFSGSERLLRAVPDRASLVVRLDTFLSGRGRGDLLDAALTAPALQASADLVDRLLDTAATPDIDLLVAERYVVCPTCRTLNGVSDYAAARAAGDDYSCSDCGSNMAGVEPAEVTRYRLSPRSLHEAEQHRAAQIAARRNTDERQLAGRPGEDSEHQRPVWQHADIRRDALRVILAIILLGAALLGFAILPWPGSLLWLLFLILAFPLGLAFTQGEALSGKDLVQMYRIGASQIPAIGKLLERVGLGRNEPPRT